MRLAWLYKESEEDEGWQISFTEPPSYYVCITPIVYAVVQPGTPT